MASVMDKQDSEKDGEKESGKAPPPATRLTVPTEGGFFHIVKRGQGYWTRMGTAGVALMLIALISFNTHIILRDQFKVRATLADLVGKTFGFLQYIPLSLLIAVVVAAVLALISWRLMNKPTNVDFLVATDSEMKKVNWTSRKDLFGATKVVIIFMFLIATILLVIDLEFGQVFWYLRVLEIPPISWGVNVANLTGNELVASTIYYPETKNAIVKAHELVGPSLTELRAAGITSVDVAPSGLIWFLCHAPLLLIAGALGIRAMRRRRSM
jgi:preprotein translocase SecE subunit